MEIVLNSQLSFTCAHQVTIFIDCICFYSRKDKIFDKFLLQILNEYLWFQKKVPSQCLCLDIQANSLSFQFLRWPVFIQEKNTEKK